jgi:hypothetical protein
VVSGHTHSVSLQWLLLCLLLLLLLLLLLCIKQAQQDVSHHSVDHFQELDLQDVARQADRELASVE